MKLLGGFVALISCLLAEFLGLLGQEHGATSFPEESNLNNDQGTIRDKLDLRLDD